MFHIAMVAICINRMVGLHAKSLSFKHSTSLIKVRNVTNSNVDVLSTSLIFGFDNMMSLIYSDVLIEFLYTVLYVRVV